MFISPENKLEYIEKTKAYRLSVYSKEIHKDLINLGCIPNKSPILNFPNFLNKRFIRHFIRGYFDGDGCICISNNKGHFNLLGNKTFLEEVQRNLCDNIKIYTPTSISKKSSENIYVFQKSSNMQLKKLFEYLYEDTNIYLERKFIKFKLAVSSSN